MTTKESIVDESVYSYFYSSKQDNLDLMMTDGFMCNKNEVEINGEWHRYSEIKQGIHEKNNWDDCRLVGVSSMRNIRSIGR